MKKTERLEEATAPDGTVLTLYRHDGDYFIQASGVSLMSTRRHRSEEALAERVCEPLRAISGATVLIGGLGFGFTLKAALAKLGADARVTVVEIMREVIDWNANPAYALAGASLADPRVTVVHDDVVRVLATSPGVFDAILLDVDNGAEALTTADNAGLYTIAGIEIALAALRSGGTVAYWSDRDDPRFRGALERVGTGVEMHRVPSHPGSNVRHMLFLVRRRDSRLI